MSSYYIRIHHINFDRDKLYMYVHNDIKLYLYFITGEPVTIDFRSAEDRVQLIEFMQYVIKQGYNTYEYEFKEPPKVVTKKTTNKKDKKPEVKEPIAKGYLDTSLLAGPK